MENDKTTAEPFGKKNPFPSELIKKYELTLSGSVKSTQHYEFSLAGSGFSYEVGDVMALFPENDPADVDEILDALPIDTEKCVVECRWGRGEISLRQALIDNYDLRGLNKKLMTGWAERCGHPYIKALVESDDKDALNEFMEGREVVDLVTDFPAAFKDGNEFASMLRNIAPRLYSIASSLKAHPDEVHLTVATVSYEAHGRKRKGVASNFLRDRLATGGKARCWMQTSKHFKLPENGETDIIMVGPGTGIAPFRAFLEERQATGAKGRNWLFFGNPYEKTDFFYKDEFEAMQANGVLTTLTTAWSRDQAHKIYVQNRIAEQGEELWKWIEGGAIFYVCGDATYMAKDVDAALVALVAEGAGLSEEDATAYVAQMKKDKRYQRDVY